MSKVVGKVGEVVKHSLLRTLSVVCVLAVIAGISWAIYLAFIRPTTKPTATQAYQAQTINVYYVYPNKKGFSLLNWGTWHLISKDARDMNPVIKTEVINATTNSTK